MKRIRLHTCLAILVVIALGCATTRTLLFLSAASSGQTDTVKRLLDEKGVPLNHTDTHGNSALMVAAREGRVETVSFLLSRDAYTHTKNRVGDTALTLAEKNGHAEVVRILREAGAEE